MTTARSPSGPAAATSSLSRQDADVKNAGRERRPTASQRAWLARGLDQPGGKLPLFDPLGRRVSARTVQACIKAGWAEPWFDNPVKPDWQVCKLTEAGRSVLETGKGPASRRGQPPE